MKKRALAVTLAVMMAASLSACGSSNSGSGSTTAAPAETTTAAEAKATEAETTADTAVKSETSDGYELALVTDLGTIDDKSFNQGAWEGMKKYAEENGISYKYYQPQEGTTDSYLETIGLAIEGGAKLVVCPGSYLKSLFIWHRTSTRTYISFFWMASLTAATTRNTEPKPM